MPIRTKEDWKAWQEERHRFKYRESEGFTKDLEALRLHILKLQEVCPKDSAGWLPSHALNVIDLLRSDYNRFQGWAEQLR